MIRIVNTFYGFDCRLLQKVNRHFDKKFLNLFFRMITHLGGAPFTISAALILLLMVWNDENNRLIAFSSALSLTLSHIPVQLVKRFFPRKRPYLKVPETKHPEEPLQDHSFPSGHTTAIFSLVIPYVLSMPDLFFILVPIGIFVGISRIYLGLHYPSDVVAGGVLGTGAALLCIFIFGM
jgi:undecaprenyl-diphosphatase